MADQQTYLSHSLIQHGSDNDRIYLMKLSDADNPTDIAKTLRDQATSRGYSKIFAKIPAQAETEFRQFGFQREGLIPRFYHGKQDAVFMGCFLNAKRAHCNQQQEITDILALAKSKADHAAIKSLPACYQIMEASISHADQLATLYRQIFPSYPFPIHDPDYIKTTMQSHIRYYGIMHAEQIVAAASAEMDTSAANAEMTDFATLPDHLGQGLAVQLLRRMETDMATEGMQTLYTIARALSAGMNITFAKCGYRFGGTLIHNTQIAGQIESMNLWYKNQNSL